MKPILLRSLVIAVAVFRADAGFSQDQKPAPPRKVDFVRDVKPLFEGACLQCHRPDSEEKNGKYFMDTRDGAFKDDAINPEDVNDSPVYWMTTVHLDDPDDDDAMPPKRPLNAQQSQLIYDWIAGGAEWPDGVTLSYTPRVVFGGVRPLLKQGPPFSMIDVDTLRYWAEQGADWPEGASLMEQGDRRVDDIELTRSIRERILKTSRIKAEAEMEAYAGTIPKSGAGYEMVPIPGGEFTMGSPDSEKGRQDDEGPQHRVKIDPFWMGKYEVTWDMYDPYMTTSFARNKDGSRVKLPPDAEDVDVVSAPTSAYVEMSFSMGTLGYPAISMTQHAANKFCQWVSAQTGHFYRLPTEAEWEYACRAGTTGPYHCDVSELEQYAVFDPKTVRIKYEKVGTKKPNPWGLHDMHGNVLEWCLDQYEPGYGNRAENEVTDNPWMKPELLYPRAARGGSWYDTEPELLRSAARSRSEENWKNLDPQLPKSIWYHTDTRWLGFRIVRPLAVPELEEMHDAWNLGTKDKHFGIIMSLLEPGETPADFVKEIKPLLERGGPFSPEEIGRLRLWTRGGAEWPDDAELGR